MPMTFAPEIDTVMPEAIAGEKGVVGSRSHGCVPPESVAIVACEMGELCVQLYPAAPSAVRAAAKVAMAALITLPALTELATSVRPVATS